MFKFGNKNKKEISIKDVKNGDVIYIADNVPVTIVDKRKGRLERLKTYRLLLKYNDGYISEVYFPLDAYLVIK